MALVGEGSTSDTPDGGELPHAQDRLWRHPAERGAEQAAANLAARKTGGRNWSNHIMSFIAGGAVVGLVWLLQTEPEVPVAQNTVIEFADRPVADTVPDRLSFDVWVEDVARPNRMSVVSLHLAGDVEQNLAQSVRLGTDGHLITSAHAIAGAEEIWAALPMAIRSQPGSSPPTRSQAWPYSKSTPRSYLLRSLRAPTTSALAISLWRYLIKMRTGMAHAPSSFSARDRL